MYRLALFFTIAPILLFPITVATTCLLGGCKGDSPPPSPPPAAEGKCLVDLYIGTRAKNQTCIHQGYTWNCVNDGRDFTCQRGLEAKGELGAGAGSSK